MRVSPDGERIAYMATLPEGGEAVFVNDEQSPRYEGIVNDSLSFSPDSKRVAWGALRDGRKVVVVDGKEFPAYDGSAEGMPVWSPDSKRFAFFASMDGRIAAVVDGKADEGWDTVIKESFVFSSDSSRFAFIAKDGDYGRVVVDGKAGPRHRNVAGFTFGRTAGTSPTSRCPSSQWRSSWTVWKWPERLLSSRALSALTDPVNSMSFALRERGSFVRKSI